MSIRHDARASLRAAIAEELALPLPEAIGHVAEVLAARGHGAATAVLFYGSNLRSGNLEGVLDYYVLVDSLRRWYGRWLPAAANRVLPPSILYVETPWAGQTLRAKVAVLRVDQFRRAMRRRGLDTTMWARYSQPAALAWSRDAAGREAAVEAVADAVISAAGWAARLGPARGPAGEYWQSLFKRTYGAELRVERASRTDSLMAYGGPRYDRLLPLAWTADGLAFATLPGGTLSPALGSGARRAARWGWALRHALGKPLNFVRLMKSAYTFDGGVDYVLWKIERHSGVKMELTPWQRRHPILASPWVFWQLKKRGAIR
jgi:hypothetical protein